MLNAQWMAALGVTASVILSSSSVFAGFQNAILKVDVTDPSRVVFSSTGESPIADDATTSTFEGFILESFFTSAINIDEVFLNPSGLTPGATVDEPEYENLVYDNIWGELGTTTAINIYSIDDELQIFDTSTEAFISSADADLFAYAAFLPAPGESGLIRVGDNLGNGSTVIGEWHAVPLPPSALLLVGPLVAGWFGIKYGRVRQSNSFAAD